MVMAGYIAIMYVTQGFAFGPYQIRIATALYALAALFSFLVVPLAIANAMSNFFFGTLGVLDVLGGLIVGIITAGTVWGIVKARLPRIFIVLPIVLGPGLIVPIWLSQILGLPYTLLVVQLSIGQIVPGVVGYLLVQTLSKRGENRI